MDTFPSYLVLAPDNFSETVAPVVYRTQMEQGLPKQLKGASRVLIVRPVTYLALTLADYQSFKTWHRVNVNVGADWFNWTDPVDSTTKLARIKEGKYVGKPWEGIATLARWEIAFELETWSN
jgi:hypothetical protein